MWEHVNMETRPGVLALSLLCLCCPWEHDSFLTLFVRAKEIRFQSPVMGDARNNYLIMNHHFRHPAGLLLWNPHRRLHYNIFLGGEDKDLASSYIFSASLRMHNISSLLPWGVSCVALEAKTLNKGEASISSRRLLPTRYVRTCWVSSALAPLLSGSLPGWPSAERLPSLTCINRTTGLAFQRKEITLGSQELKFRLS